MGILKHTNGLPTELARSADCFSRPEPRGHAEPDTFTNCSIRERRRKAIADGWPSGCVFSQPHWYLADLRVDPVAQGKGLGRAAVEMLLALGHVTGSAVTLVAASER